MPGETGSQAISLPSIAEIEAANEVLSMPERLTKVIQVKEHFVVEFGNCVPLSEAGT